MNAKTVLLGIVAAAGVAFANPSFLASEYSPMSLSIGKSYDLLDIRTPLSRTYSAAGALKDKTEITFFHSVFGMDDVAAENVMLSLKNTILPGMRMAAYLSYFGLGAFEQRNERAETSVTLFPSMLYVGVPVIFDVKSLTLEDYTIVTNNKKELRGRNMLKDFLSCINAAVNINYFQSQLTTDYHAFSLFADANITAKFALPYIGMPKSLITEDDLEREKKDVIGGADREYAGRMNTLTNTKGLTPQAVAAKTAEYSTVRTEFIDKTEKEYAAKKADIARVHASRKQIFEIYYSPDIELKDTDVSNFNAVAKKELLDLTVIASNAIADNFAYLRKNIGADMQQNAEDISNYTEKLKDAAKAPVFFDNALAVSALYSEYIANEGTAISKYIKEDVAEKSKKVIEADKQYTVKRDDTWTSIALAHYGDTALAGIITAYNKIDVKKIAKPLPGTMIKIPPQKKPEVTAAKDDAGAVTGNIEEYNAARAKRFEKFLRDKDKAEVPVRAYRMTQKEELYYKKIIETYEQRILLFDARNQIVLDTKRKYSELNQGLLEQYKALDTTTDELQKDLTKAKLKKDLDYLQVADQNEVKTVFNEYKKRERELFLSLLQEIFRTKNRIITVLKKEESDKADKQDGNIIAVYNRKAEIARVQNSAARIEAGANEKMLAKISEEYASETKKMELSRGEELSGNRAAYLRKVNEFDWQLYITELIYLSSDEKKNTFAFGVYGKNLGMPVTFDKQSELLPMAFGLDLNYRFLDMENNASTLYLHGGYSDVDNVTVGGGVMYRMFNLLELRGGTWYEFFPATPDRGELSFSGAAGVIFDIGLMSYRVDAGARYEANYGLTYSAGLTVVF
ncbi:MAG: hypothetical protein HZC28_15935 [Spirochaetes bacterium]|nr:hypothetical protein [Spirochaetota bacterium]